MSGNPESSPAARRQRRALATDATILDAAVHLASEEGWGALTPGHLAEVTGLSRPTVLQRHADRAAVGAATWRHLAEGFTAALAHLVDVGTHGPVDPSTLISALAPFTSPDTQMRAAVELLVVANHVPEVGVAVDETLGASLSAWFTVGRGAASRSLAARRAFLVSMAIGYVLESRRLGGIAVDLSTEVEHLAHALTTPTAPVRLPTAQARHFDAPIFFDTGDSTLDAVLRATLECVGQFGYEASTIEVIAARCGFTRTAIFTRYATKAGLFIDATDRMLGAAARANIEYQQAIERTNGPGIPDTCFVREIIKPSRRRLRTIMLEQVRLAAHNEQLQTAIRDSAAQFEAITAMEDPTMSPERIRAKLITDMAVSTGSTALAQVTDLVWNLPFDVVLVPWRTIST